MHSDTTSITAIAQAPRRRDDRREELFAAALRQYAKHGYKRTRVEDIAAELGLTKGAVYFYAKGKEELYREAISWALGEWCSAIERSAARASSSVERVSILSRSSFAYVEAHHDLRSVIARDPSIFSLDPASDRFASVNDRARGLLESAIRSGVASGEFRSTIDPSAASRFLYQVYITFLIKAFALGEGDELAAQYEAGTDIALMGLAAR
ncbi:MAG TPA: TetR/AcrR family transcriptional regulator [Spirochaetales bacterium]|nr:TetR/AcrR family transcriptional regulator [Spirochaetales bacterium]